MGTAKNLTGKEEIREFQIFNKPAGPRCNLSCNYCYYLDKLEQYDGKIIPMPDDLLDSVIKQQIDASNGTVVTFSWHGGEPLLAGIEFYRKAVDLQKKHCPEGKRIVNGIQTNGTLLNEAWCEFLSHEKFIVGISIDGPDKYHDMHRKGKDGNGTFQKVIKAWDLMSVYDMDPEILCVLNSFNASSPLEIYRFFKHLGASYITFIPLVEQITGTSKVSARSVTPEKFGDFLCTVFDEWCAYDIGKVKVQIFEEALRSAFGQGHTLCVFKPVCGGVPVLEHNGDFFCCDHYVDSHHRIGNIKEITISKMLDSDLQHAFGLSKKSTLPPFCLKCEVLELCNGECMKNRFTVTPEGDAGLNYLCEGYRKFFNHCKPFIHAVKKVYRGAENASQRGS